MRANTVLFTFGDASELIWSVIDVWLSQCEMYVA